MKIKKHELIAKATKDYPNGTLARFKSAPNVDHVSDGTFKIVDGTGNGTVVSSHNDQNCFYCSRGDEWAVPFGAYVCKSEDGEKLYVNQTVFTVNNYNGKGDYRFQGEKEVHRNMDNILSPHIKVFSTEAAAKEFILKNKVVITTEDGAGLKIGDKFYHVTQNKTGEWALNTSLMYDNNMFTINHDLIHLVFTNPDKNRAFNSRDEAFMFINKENKPKSFKLFSDSNLPIEVFKDHIEVQTKTYERVRLEQKDLDLIFSSYKALNI